MAKRIWKGPWHSVESAARYTNKGGRENPETGRTDVSSFRRFVRRSLVLKAARVPEGEGAKNIRWSYPQEALDHAMNLEGYSPEQVETVNRRNAEDAA